MLSLPDEAELDQNLKSYAEQVGAFRAAEMERAKKDQEAAELRRKIEERDRIALAEV